MTTFKYNVPGAGVTDYILLFHYCTYSPLPGITRERTAALLVQAWNAKHGSKYIAHSAHVDRYHGDSYIPELGRRLALRKLLHSCWPTLDRNFRTAVWDAYWASEDCACRRIPTVGVQEEDGLL